MSFITAIALDTCEQAIVTVTYLREIFQDLRIYEDPRELCYDYLSVNRLLAPTLSLGGLGSNDYDYGCSLESIAMFGV